jgi:hypothetical protein
VSDLIVAEIKKQLNELFSNTAVKPEQTREWLEDVKLEIDDMLDTLPPKDE